MFIKRDSIGGILVIKITGNDIKELNDTDLRSLIALLCEAELRAQNIPTAGVTWGGNQTDADGGLDVKVEVTSALLKDSYIPKSKTGFQVKKPDMPPCAIKNEMRPAGILRAVIKKLVDDGGAYIIVSGQGSTADSALKNRKEAMRQVILDAGLDVTKVKLDFYDRERVAGWVRSHPAMIIWVKEKIGKAVSGWKAYENWAKCPDGIIEEYILDEQLRVYDDSNDFPGKYSAIDGMNRVRCVLQSGEVVRLVGLSGVGKTRFLQALFDDRIGENPLNQSKVFMRT